MQALYSPYSADAMGDPAPNGEWRTRLPPSLRFTTENGLTLYEMLLARNPSTQIVKVERDLVVCLTSPQCCLLN